MKALILALFASTIASAYNTQYEKAAYGQITVVGSKKTNTQSEVVSFLIDTRSKNPTNPVVVNYTPWSNQCAHKQTLLAYSGFDARTREHIRTYEVQIVVNGNRHGKTCTFLVKPTKNSLIQESARISIL